MGSAISNCRTLADLLEQSSRLYRDRLAVRDVRGSSTYGQLHESAMRIAVHLHGKGVRQGDRVALIMNNRSEFAQIEQALALGGFVRVCAITRLHPNEVAHILSDADPAYAFIEESWLRGAGSDFLTALPCPAALVGTLDGGSRDVPAGIESFESFLTPVDITRTWATPQPDDLAWLMYTSGSTGTPKGVMHTHRTITAMVKNILQVMRTANQDDVAVHTAPLSHFSGAIAHAVWAVGGTNILLERFQPAELFGEVDRYGVTVLPVVPTQLNMLTDYLREAPRDCSGIRILPYAGSAIAPDRLAAAKGYFGDALVQYYGASEVPMPITALYPEDHVGTINELGLPRFAAGGRPIEGVEISIRDADNKPLERGAHGEITVKSPAGSPGYWRNPEATSEILEPDGFIHTGDIGVFDRDGFLYIVDRKKEMIVTGGFNVFPREVENAIMTMPAVREVAVVSMPDQKWGEAIVAVVAPKPDQELTIEQVQAYCRERLAGYKIPRHLRLMDELPKGSTGKLLKRALKEEYWGAHERKIGG